MSELGATDGTENTKTKWTESECGSDILKHALSFFLANGESAGSSWFLKGAKSNYKVFVTNTHLHMNCKFIVRTQNGCSTLASGVSNILAKLQREDADAGGWLKCRRGEGAPSQIFGESSRREIWIIPRPLTPPCVRFRTRRFNQLNK